MPTFKVALTLLLVTLPLYLFPQSKKQAKTFNTTKLDLVFKRVNINEYSSTGASRSYFRDFPYLIVNNAKPVKVDKRAELLRKYYTRAPLANEEINLMMQDKRRGRAIIWTGFIGGGAYAMSGVFAKADFGDHSKFYTRGIIGSVVILGSGYLWWMYNNRADKHLRRSVDVYNQKYYKPLKADSASTATAAVVAPAVEKETTAIIPSDKKIYEDTSGLFYNQMRNDPGNSGLWGLSINYANLEVNSLNTNMTGGLGVFYTYRSLVRINADYNIGYFDLVTGPNKNNPPTWQNNASYGIPVSYAKPTLLDLQLKLSLFSWESQGDYHVYLGRERIEHLNVTKLGAIRGTIRRAITNRIGYMIDNKVIESRNGIGFTTSTAPYSFTADGQDYTLSPQNLATSAAMLKSGIINIGVAYTIFKDLKVNLSGDYKGRKQEKSQFDAYIDLLYAQSQKLQDIVYYHWVQDIGESIPQQLDISGSSMRKIGVRIGCSQISYNRFFGTRYGMEIGIKPGPASADGNAYGKLNFAVVFGGRTKSKK